jgi:two-component system, NarL family, nitrate/nitrite response regulator NarL
VHRFSNREQTILDLLMQGSSNKRIARQLNIAEPTVKVHIKTILRKLGFSNRTQAAIWARDHVRPNEQLKRQPPVTLARG